MDMSFSDSLKSEVIQNGFRSNCCIRSFLLGALINAECGIDGQIYVRISGCEVGAYVAKLIKGQFGRDPEVAVGKYYGKTVTELSFSSRRVSSFLEALSNGGKIDELTECRCENCKNAFICGVILAAGRISDPAKEPRVELSIYDPARADDLRIFLTESIGKPIISTRNSAVSLIFKRKDDVENLLGATGASLSMLYLYDKYIEREVNNEVNRASNRDMGNIQRVVVASQKSIDTIKKMQSEGMFELLDDELLKTAELRLLYPELPLVQLAAMHDTKLSKSGLAHRLRKIVDIYEKHRIK